MGVKLSPEARDAAPACEGGIFMRGAKRLFFALLALAVVSALAPVPADAEESGCRLTVLNAQTLTEGAAFDPDTAPATKTASPGDIIVLTLGFRNDSGAAASMVGFSVQLLYDKEKVSPYAGAAPFEEAPYQASAELADSQWMCAGNAGDGVALVSGMGIKARSVESGAELPLCRVAFRAEAEGVATFSLNAGSSKNRVIPPDRKAFPLDASKPFDLAIGAYEIAAVETDRRAGTCKVTLSNPEAATVAAAFFDADGRFAAAVTVAAPPQCGSVSLPLPDALPANGTATVALLASDWKPLSCLSGKIA